MDSNNTTAIHISNNNNNNYPTACVSEHTNTQTLLEPVQTSTVQSVVSTSTTITSTAINLDSNCSNFCYFNNYAKQSNEPTIHSLLLEFRKLAEQVLIGINAINSLDAKLPSLTKMVNTKPIRHCKHSGCYF